MIEFSDLILAAGRSAVELTLFILLPVMIVMMAIMRLLEAYGVLDRVVRVATPLLRPFGIPGLGVFAMLQVLLVSFAAPVATLAMMDRGGVSSRHIAATLAMVLTLAQANVVFPMAAVGLDVGLTLSVALVCAIIAAALTYHVFARHLSSQEAVSASDDSLDRDSDPSLLAVINRAGRDAFDIAIAALPMLVLALVLVYLLRAVGVVDGLERLLEPLFLSLGLPAAALLPVVSKFVAGGTAMMGVSVDYIQTGLISAQEFNRMAGLLIHPLDIAGVAVLISAGRRVSAVVRPALLGAAVAILLRAVTHFWLF